MNHPFWHMMACCILLVSCGKPSRVEQYKTEKHMQDSVRLTEQERTLTFYETQLDTLMPVADSLLNLFVYEKNEKYQDHGNYVLARGSMRILVRDDGKELLVYMDGKRLTQEQILALNNTRTVELIDRAEHLQVAIQDIKELEKRIQHTSLEVQKYQKRLQKE